MKNYYLHKDGTDILINAQILDVYVDDSIGDGGFTIEFLKDGKKGIFVLGYTELGEWVGMAKFINHEEEPF